MSLCLATTRVERYEFASKRSRHGSFVNQTYDKLFFYFARFRYVRCVYMTEHQHKELCMENVCLYEDRNHLI